jgi:hypothetical protein
VTFTIITESDKSSTTLRAGDRCKDGARTLFLSDKNFEPTVLKPGEIENKTLELDGLSKIVASPGDRFAVCMVLTYSTHKLGIQHAYPFFTPPHSPIFQKVENIPQRISRV